MAFHLNVSEFETHIDIQANCAFKNNKNCKLKNMNVSGLETGK